jgi:hypothetical protein
LSVLGSWPNSARHHSDTEFCGADPGVRQLRLYWREPGLLDVSHCDGLQPRLQPDYPQRSLRHRSGFFSARGQQKVASLLDLHLQRPDLIRGGLGYPLHEGHRGHPFSGWGLKDSRGLGGGSAAYANASAACLARPPGPQTTATGAVDPWATRVRLFDPPPTDRARGRSRLGNAEADRIQPRCLDGRTEQVIEGPGHRAKRMRRPPSAGSMTHR